MTPRTKPLTVPASPRYWSVEVEDKGAHDFRAPYYGVGDALLAHVGRHIVTSEDDRPLQAKLIVLLPALGAVVGACWWHRLHALDAALPLAALDDEHLTAYSVAVVDELQEAGYNLLDLMALYAGCLPEMQRRQSIAAMAEERASFSVAPKAEPISS